MSDDELDYSLPPWSRTLANWRQRFVLPYEFTLGADRLLVLEQAPCVSSEHATEASGSADGLCTASTVWDAGIVLAAHLRRPPSEVGSGGRCLDLGSGTGIVGLAAASSGVFSRVVLTDLPSVVPLLERNVAANLRRCAAAVEVLPLRWDDEGALRSVSERGPFDLIVGGDLLYRQQVVEPLLGALCALCSRQTTVLLAASLQHSPETIRSFRRAAAAAGFDVQQLLGSEAQHPEFTSPEVRLLRLRLAGGSGADAGVGGGEGGGGTATGPERERAPRKKRRREKQKGNGKATQSGSGSGAL